MLGSYEHVGNALRGLFRQFNWHIISLLYHNHGEATGRGNSDCSFSLSAIARNFKNTTSFQEPFDEERSKRDDFRRLLRKIKQNTRSECKIKTKIVFTRNFLLQFIIKMKNTYLTLNDIGPTFNNTSLSQSHFF